MTKKEIKFFKSSDYPVASEVTAFLKKNTVGIAYNKFCIDCKMNKSTHFIVWTGTFVCGACGKIHRQMCGNSMRNCYVKTLSEGEHWDDYQLRSIQMGGNKPLYECMKDYELLELPIAEKYRQPVVIWYIRRHAAKLDGRERLAAFDAENAKPPLGAPAGGQGDWSIKTKTALAEKSKQLGDSF